MNEESAITNKIRLHLEDKFPGVILWRNSIGFDTRAKVHYGIGGKGGSDLVGIYKSRFIGIEVKAPGSRTERNHLAEQSNFIRAITDAGGLAGFASSPEEAEKIVRGEQ